ncbi:MAG: hypothetical protein ACM3NQ_16945, partial [Bacteroidales bacterium]
VACFPVYRTYVSTRGWAPVDRERIETAVSRARWRNPAVEASVFDFFREVVLPRRDEPSPPGNADGNGTAERRDGYAPGDNREYRERLTFSMHLQQFTAPVQAKGLEDTAFYRYNPLVSLNEVGGAPARFGRSIAEFHEANAARQRNWPHEMTATATHDTKLGEDVRARISVLSQIPGEWRKHVARWTRINTACRTSVQGNPAPDRNDEYRFYQVLVGVWPRPGAPADPSLVSRVRDYMMKATKEAKVHTSWVNDNAVYDRATSGFVERSLTGHGAPRFLASFLPFHARVAELALGNSLSQLVLKIAAPGVPDTYQGNELWDFRLVDPDNRSRVDFDHRVRLLSELEPQLPVSARGPELLTGCEAPEMVARLMETWIDGRIKLWVTACGLRLRRVRPALFAEGEYLPLRTSGAMPAEPVAFARTSGTSAIAAVAPRLHARAGSTWREWGAAWGNAVVHLPPELSDRVWRSALTGERLELERRAEGSVLSLARLLSTVPVGLVVAEE